MTKLPTDLIDETRRGNLVPFIGAGLSVSAGGPSWNRLITEMVSELKVDFGFDAERTEILKAVGPGPMGKKTEDLLWQLYDPLVVAQLFDRRYGRRALVSLLQKALQGAVSPTESYRLVAQLPAWAIVTTNFDALLSRACTEVGTKATVVVKDEDVAYLHRNALAIVKMHGSLGEPFDPDSVVISRADFDNYELTRPNLTAC